SADLQSQSSFAGSDVNGPYPIASSASSQTTASNTLAQINTSGGGGGGFLDINDTGSYFNRNLTGSYTVDASGHVAGIFNTILNGIETDVPFTMYLVSPTRAYYLDLRTQIEARNGTESLTGGGIVYAQTTN